MAATSTSANFVSLPSIHEMFPEHLMHLPPRGHPIPQHTYSSSTMPIRHSTPRVAPKPYERLPLPSSLPPVPLLATAKIHASPIQRSRREAMADASAASALISLRSRPRSMTSRSYSHSPSISPLLSERSLDDEVSERAESNSTHSSEARGEHDRDAVGSLGGEDWDSGVSAAMPSAASTRKHVCPVCQKRFNRPSSLRIHVNTHTGATPFRCPYPGCGRSFNVNSNMRRHLRNHGAETGSVPSVGAGDDGDSDTTGTPSLSPARWPSE
ncbi:hypothetical protein HMN09_00575900 [Mycena chlorophos]|uniref:C2H2-type domain-containing protein n=1 Tax=Mycena chlorophos TaxID=658473 RepID=A0A8H6TB27_MYCCL|nr:hypothetical protein HMN09_00575900 [Mycena chlorophos]